VVPAVATLPVPTGWADEQALGLMVSWPTALAAVRQLGHVGLGQTVLIHAAAGGTGQAAVRMAKHFGATVIGVASTGKFDAVRAAGADQVLDAGATDLAADVIRATCGAGVDLVLDLVGGTGFETSLAVAKRVTGRVVVCGLPGGKATISNWDLVYRHQVHMVGLNIGVLARSAPQVFGAVMQELLGLIDRGVIGPVQPATYPLADGSKALLDLESRATVGKVALLP
jgi:NADPH2:quinone reductase